MPFPTLLRKGFVVPPKGSTEKEIKLISNIVSIDYILHLLSSKIPVSRQELYIKDAPKTYGDKVIILKSDTGSGKSTVLPAQLYTKLFHRTARSIIVTQPRTLTAMDIPGTMIPHNPELEMDKNIGYSTGPFKRLPRDKGIVFATVGVLTQELIMNNDIDFMTKYQFILIDEVHTRDIDTDRCLFLLKKLIKTNYKNPACPIVILMSATFNENVFIEYFEVPAKNYIQVVGSTFPIEMEFTPYSVNNYLKYASLQAQKIHLDNLADLENDNEFRDIILFVKDAGIGKKIYIDLHLFNSTILTSTSKIMSDYSIKLGVDMKSMLKTGGASKNSSDFYILPILLDTASFSTGGLEYQNLFSSLNIISTPLWKVDDGKIDTSKKPHKYVTPTRRIIIATNLAETGVTIPTLKYCIDTGYQISSEFYPEYGCSGLISKNISHGSAVQRRGRVGRQSPGFFYPCYTEDTFKALPSESIADIITADTTEILLSMLIREKNTELVQEYSINRIKNNKNENIFQMFTSVSNNWYMIKNELMTNISNMDFIETPSIQMLGNSIEKLHGLGFIDSSLDITTIGFFANQLRFISLELRKMIFAGYFFKANILDLITIASFVYITKRKVFEKTFKLENFMKVNDTEFQFYNQILIADDFIVTIFVWNIFQDFIKHHISTSKKIQLIKIREWCTQTGIIFSGLTLVISARDILIRNMIDIGLNPYYNGLALQPYNLNTILLNSLSDASAEIKKIKSCIYEGFKFNLLQHKQFSVYQSVCKNIPIKVKSLVVKELNDDAEQKYPLLVICDAYMITAKYGSSQHEFIAAGFISVMDNFVEVDTKFTLY